MVTMLEYLSYAPLVREICDPDKIKNKQLQNRTNCCNCGAPMCGSHCEYCGTNHMNDKT